MPQYTTSFTRRSKREDPEDQVVTPEVIFPQLGGALLDTDNDQQDQLSHLVKEKQLKSQIINQLIFRDF